MTHDSDDIKRRIIDAGYAAINQLIFVAEEDILKPFLASKKNEEADQEFATLAADRLKNAAAAKKMAIFDAFEILSRIENEKEIIGDGTGKSGETGGGHGFAERRSRK